MKPINLKEHREKKEPEKDTIFPNYRRNYVRKLDDFERELMDLYLKTDVAMRALFKHLNQPWRDSHDHLPLIVHLAMQSITEKLKK